MSEKGRDASSTTVHKRSFDRAVAWYEQAVNAESVGPTERLLVERISAQLKAVVHREPLLKGTETRGTLCSPHCT